MKYVLACWRVIATFTLYHQLKVPLKGICGQITLRKAASQMPYWGFPETLSMVRALRSPGMKKRAAVYCEQALPKPVRQ